MADMNCTVRKMAVRYDSNIQRLVMTVKFEATGMSKMERSTV